jgi:ribose transport system permease protein
VTADTLGLRRPGRFRSIRLTPWTGPLWIWVIFGGVFLIAALRAPEFFTSNNLWDVARQSVPLAIVAIGETVVILTGGIDISVAPVISMGCTLSLGIMNGQDGRLWPAVLAAIGAGLVVGIVNGVVISAMNAPAFIVTLGVGTVVQGIIFWYTNYASYGLPAPKLFNVGFSNWGPVPQLVVLFLPLLIVALILQNRTIGGKHLYAVGGDPDVARRAGLAVNRIKITAYAISGALAALAGVAIGTRTGSGEPLSGTGFDWDAVAAVVMGGTSLLGGKGGVGGTMVGVLIISVINDAMNLLGVSTFYQFAVKGVIILLAVVTAALAVMQPFGDRAMLRGLLERGWRN